MSQPPLASSQQRSASAGNYPSSSSSAIPFASASTTSTPLLGHGSFGAGSPASNLLPSSPYAAASPASISFQHSSPFAGTLAAHATSTFRKLVWEGTIPICVSIDPAELPPGSDSSIDSTYLVVPRISYLPLIVADVKKNLLDLVLEQPALNALNEKELWFEYEGQPLRWHWQIGLLYDYHTSNPARTAIAYQSTTANASGLGSLRSDTPSLAQGTNDGAAMSAAQPSRLPWNIRLRLSKPPADRLHSNSGLESCKTSFMSMIKEADFVRYGSTKKVVNLRKQEQDTLWDGVVSHDYDVFWSIANKLVPNANVSAFEAGHSATTALGRSPIASRTVSLNLGGTHDDRTAPPVQRSLTTQPNESQASLAPSTVSTITSTTSSDAPSATSGTATPSAGTTVRSIPMRIFLPDNAPIVQEPVPPTLEDGRANTLGAVLSALFPLLFPPPPSFSSFQAQAPPLAYALVQGVRMPLDAEIAWLGSALVGPDGWVAVVIGLVS
ncbi:related to ATG5-protein involved in autophagy and the Cvt pathway [Sporisorium reilianum f. sp. reilianum]|uniref:Autophagy protein 5 n=1 Tax=Sporisorium reilianum f. sp. reilianum TaxID=72559 RepID=A0A2N8UMG4_9BASI|nr:related to ATG5-protein involved in autophagy and the Cvt pathway [Sporisorium reilianum f. sp. reilianum]